jgi:hypothetical protein
MKTKEKWDMDFKNEMDFKYAQNYEQDEWKNLHHSDSEE